MFLKKSKAGSKVHDCCTALAASFFSQLCSLTMSLWARKSCNLAHLHMPQLLSMQHKGTKSKQYRYPTRAFTRATSTKATKSRYDTPARVCTFRRATNDFCSKMMGCAGRCKVESCKDLKGFSGQRNPGLANLWLESTCCQAISNPSRTICFKHPRSPKSWQGHVGTIKLQQVQSIPNFNVVTRDTFWYVLCWSTQGVCHLLIHYFPFLVWSLHLSLNSSTSFCSQGSE